MTRNNRTFPCCVCGAPLEVRETKKGKPHLICDSCGLQIFIRYAVGIKRFETLLAETHNGDIRKLLAILAQRYKKTCPDCGNEFWIEENQIKTSGWSGEFKGFECPKCGGLVKAQKENI